MKKDPVKVVWKMHMGEQSHLKIIERLKDEIDEERFSEQERFPSEFQLAKRFDVGLSVIREAMQTLLDEKVLIEKHGVGLFINPKPLFTAGIEELTSVSSMIEQAGMAPGTIFIDFSEGYATEEEAGKFNCKPNEKLMTIKRIRTANDQPVVFCIDQFLSKNYSVEAEKLLNTSIFDAIEESGDIHIEQAVAKIEPVAYDEEASSILRCGIDVPLLLLEQKHYSDDGAMILYSKNFFRADKFSFHVNRTRV